MSLTPEDRSWIGRAARAAGARRRRPSAQVAATQLALAAVALVTLAACGARPPRAPTPQGAATTTAANVAPRIKRLVVAEPGSISMVSRDGCLATVRTSEGRVGAEDELRVRCPKPDRLRTWFDGAERVTSALAVEPISAREEDEGGEIDLPAAKLLTESGKMLRITKAADVERLAGEVRALSAELAAAERVAPGPASANGWEMLHVSGPAHVLFAGTPANGVLEARVSTNGQYLCEFVTDMGDGSSMRATKSGWIKPAAASHAIDEVLSALLPVAPEETPATSYAAGVKGGAESRSSASSTAAVFDRFAAMQEALGDACLPELEAPVAPPIGL